MSTAELSPFAPSFRLNDEARDDALLEARARHDEGLDGGARELGENERRTMHRTVVIPKRLQLRTLCACRDEGLKRTWERSEDVSPARFFSRAAGRRKKEKQNPSVRRFRFARVHPQKPSPK